VLGEPAYDDELADVEADVDLVNVFRPSEDPGDPRRGSRERHAERGDAGAAWINWGSATTGRPRTRSQTGSRSFRTAV